MIFEGREAVEAPAVAFTYTSSQDRRNVGLVCRSPATAVATGRIEQLDEDAAISQRWVLTFFEFVDDGQFSNLESVLVQVGATRCFYAGGGLPAADAKQLTNIMDTLDIVAEADCRRNEFGTSSIEQDLTRLLGQPNLSRYPEEQKMGLCLAAAACLIRRLDLLSDEQNMGNTELAQSHLSKYVRLDAAATKALNLLPYDKRAHRNASLLGLLDHCKTKMGRRLLERWIRQPLVDVDAIRERHSIVTVLTDRGSDLRQRLQEEGFSGGVDLAVIMRKLERKSANLKDLCQLYDLANSITGLVNILQEEAANAADGDGDGGGGSGGGDGAAAPAHPVAAFEERIVAPLRRLDESFAKYRQLVETVIDLDAKAEGKFLIAPEHSEELKELKDAQDKTYDDIEGCLADARGGFGRSWKKNKKASADSEIKLVEDKNEGYIFRAPKTKDVNAAIRGKPKVFRLIKDLKDGIYFTTLRECPSLEGLGQALRPLAEEYQGLSEEYESKQQELQDKAVEVARTFMPVLEAAAAHIAELDVFVSFAHVAVTAMGGDYVCPTLTTAAAAGAAAGAVGAVAGGAGGKAAAEKVVIKRGRHPCMEAVDGAGSNFIPNDYNMDHAASRFQIVTGPNMGGKSTYIRQLGVIVVMAQIGSFVPAEEAVLPVMDAVLARVGAGDAQLKGISTFMSEMIEASSILKCATPRSLVLVDELGRGTSTYDGFGLAWAISEHLARETRCYTLFATHFHELCALEQKTDGVSNLHAAAMTDANTLTMLYDVKPGPCDRSFGIHVAELAKFPASVVEEARIKARELESLQTGGAAAAAGAGGAGEGAAAGGESPSKRQKTSSGGGGGGGGVDEKESRILAAFAELPINTMQPNEIVERVRALVEA